MPGGNVGRGVREFDAREAMWRCHGRDLLRYATLLVGPDDAPDLVSVALERVGRADHSVDDLRRYLMRTVTNAAVDQARSRRRRQARELKTATTGAVAAFESNVDVRRAVAGLSVQQRAVVYFTYWEDLDSSQVGQLLAITPASVRRHLARARVQLRKVLS